ncbi:MAG TPA: alpha/beta hydrolase [Rhizomicrobium sp.]|nr:alpha/beta hydrolase [Rhizomicrobium sp.]
MSLDPLVKAFLDQASMLPRPKMWEMPLSLGRQTFAQMMSMMGPKDVPVGRVHNLPIPAPGGELRARIYAPVAAGSVAHPALVYFHGGGFVVGDLDTHDGLCRLLAGEGGFVVVAVDYRRAPENKWPAAFDDAYAATRWIFANAPSLGIDAGRIAIGGDSAGAFLAASVTQAAKAHGGVSIAFQMLLFPLTDFGADSGSMNRFAVGYFLEKQTIEWCHAQVLPPGTDRAAVSPLYAKDFSGLPPAYVMLGGYDPLRDQGLAYAGKLKAARVAVTIADYPEMVHCFIYLQSVLPQAHAAVADAAAAVAKALEKA